MRDRLKLCALALTLVSFASGCDAPSTSILESTGPYRGVLALSDSGQFHEFLTKGDASAADLSIKLQVTPDSGAPFELAGKLSQNKDKLDLTAPALFDGSRTFSSGVEDCFIQGADRVCYDGHELLIELAGTKRGQLSLVLEKFDGSN